MRLNKAGSWLLYRPQFTDWLKYVDDLSVKNPAKGTSAFSTLTSHYGDAALYKMIEEAGDVLETKDLATKLQKELMQYWVTTAKSPDDVFRAMNRVKIENNILGYRDFTAWAKYADDFNAKYPEQSALMAPALRKYYSDGVLFKMTDEMISGGEFKSVATKIQDELSQLWLSSKKTPDDALVELGLGRTVDTLMESPLFNIWLKYTNAYSTRYPQDKSTVIEALTRTFGDIEVAMMLQKPQTTDATRTIAKQLESAQLEMWWSSGKSVDDVLNLLDLRMNFQFTSDPLLNTWVSYIDRVLKENPGQATTLLTTLKPRFSDKALGQFLRAAMKFPSMEKAAITIQTEKIQGYLANNQPPVQVFKLLDQDNVGYNLLSDPLFTKWMKYAKNFKHKNPKRQKLWFTPIRMYYDPQRVTKSAMNDPSTGKIAKLVQREQSKYWLHEQKSPRIVFHFLNLNKIGEKNSCQLGFQTMDQVSERLQPSVSQGKTTMLDGLMGNYIERDLLRIFDAAKKDPSTEKLAMNLQSALINKWIVKKEKPADLKRMLDGVPTSDEMVARYLEKLKALSGNTS
ncbi:hypothetical protein PF005_g18287 [Phytophthora fragariae]|nr:hypothetical protein PF009_g17266 [Phytophthora fragariae]KAE9192891.1 hypothetical protein PF005_g18287 [Phytophthora fragariae]